MNKSRRIGRQVVALAASGFVAVLGFSTAFGQAAALSGTESVQETALSEIIVTAQRREERSLDVPIAITTVNGPTLINAHIDNYLDLGQVVPGVVIGRTGSFVQPSIRGISTQASGAGGENNVSTYVNGFYRPFQGSLLMGLDNIVQVDVLKGPQGTLFGRNATGGAVMIQTQDPTAAPRGQAAVQFGSFNDFRFSGDYSGPINDQTSFAISGDKHSSNNYYTDYATGTPSAPIDDYDVGFKLKYQPTEKFSLILSYDNSYRSDASPFMYEFVAWQAAKAPPYAPSTFTSTQQNVTSLTVPSQLVNRFTSTGAKAVLKTPIGDLNSYTNYQTNSTKTNFDYDGSPVEFQEIYQDEAGHALQQEINLVSHPGRVVDYTVGAYYYHLNDDYRYFHGYFGLPAGVIGVPPNSANPSTATANWVQVWPSGRPAIKVNSEAGYADATWNVSDVLHLTGGVRYTTEKQTAYGTVLSAVESATFDDTTPRAVIRYDLDAHSNVYASYSQGFKSGTFNIFAPPFAPVLPEKLTAYEVGYKSAHDRWSFDAATFYYDYKDMQVTSIVAPAGGTPFLETTNAAKSKIYGAEMQSIFEPIDQLRVRASVAYTHARYDQFNSYSPALPNVVTRKQTTICTPAVVGPPAVPAQPCTTDLSGQQLLRAPDWTANLGLDYTWQPSIGAITASSNASYTSSFMPTTADWALNPNNIVNNIIQPSNQGKRYATPAYTLVTFNLSWHPTAATSVSVFATNAFNAQYLIVANGNGNGSFQQWGEPRTFGGRLTYKF
jgi:iron complex outermembrane receptor protein